MALIIKKYKKAIIHKENKKGKNTEFFEVIIGQRLQFGSNELYPRFCSKND